MPLVDLAGPTGLLLEWGWLLVTRANGIVYILLLVVFVLGALVPLPRARRDLARARAGLAGTGGAGAGGTQEGGTANRQEASS